MLLPRVPAPLYKQIILARGMVWLVSVPKRRVAGCPFRNAFQIADFLERIYLRKYALVEFLCWEDIAKMHAKACEDSQILVLIPQSHASANALRSGCMKTRAWRAYHAAAIAEFDWNVGVSLDFVNSLPKIVLFYWRPVSKSIEA